MERKNFKLNFFDIIIAIIIVVIAGGIYFFINKEDVVQTKKLIYTIELNNLPQGFTENIKVGDKLTDGVKNYNMGTIIAVEKSDTTVLVTDQDNSIVKEKAIPELERAVITIEADVTENGADYKVDGNFLVKAGLNVNVHGPGYAGSGYIILIER